MTPPKRLKQAMERQHESLSIAVYEQLRDKIVWGAIPPGSVLSLRQLADELSVGLMPVRDALHRLASDELVDLRPRMATRVAPISIERITEMFEVRTRLETLAGRLATTHLSVSDMRRLERYQERMQRAGARGHAEGWHKWNQEFHSLIFRRCGNSLLQRMTQNLWDRNVRLYTPRVVTQATFRNRRSAEHRSIIAAFERRDPDAVEAAYHKHMVHSGAETIAFLRTLAPQVANPQVPAHSGKKRTSRASMNERDFTSHA